MSNEAWWYSAQSEYSHSNEDCEAAKRTHESERIYVGNVKPPCDRCLELNKAVDKNAARKATTREAAKKAAAEKTTPESTDTRKTALAQETAGRQIGSGTDDSGFGRGS